MIVSIRLNEGLRQRVVHDYGIGPDAMQRNLEALNRLAALLFGFHFVNRQHTLFASQIGIGVCEVDRDISFCTHVLDRDEPPDHPGRHARPAVQR